MRKVKIFLKCRPSCQSKGKVIGELFQTTPTIQLAWVTTTLKHHGAHRQELDRWIFRTRLIFGFPFDKYIAGGTNKCEGMLYTTGKRGNGCT